MKQLLMLIANRWESLGKSVRQVAGYTITGLIIAVVVHYSHSLKWVQDQEDQGLDFVMQMNANTSSDARTPFVFLDINNDTYLKWNEQLSTPRDKLAQLIQFAIDGKAKSLTVDIDLSRSIAGQLDPVKSVLMPYTKSDNRGLTPIIFMKTYKVPEVGSRTGYRQQRSSELDDLVNRSPQLAWASPMFNQDNDFVVRRWRMWERSCNAANRPELLPSIQLYLFAMQTQEKTMEELKHSLQSYTPSDCEDWSLPQYKNMSITLGDSVIDTATKLRQRIIFQLPWEQVNSSAYPMIEHELSGETKSTPLLKVVPAHLISDSENVPDPSLLNGHHVIIGTSHDDGRDVYGTPLGWMPGALIVINAIHSMTTYGMVEEPSLWVILLSEAIVLLIVSYIFTRLRSGYAAVACSVLIFVTIIPLTFLVFKEGIWLNFAIPLLFVSVHQTLGRTGKVLKDAQALIMEKKR